MKGNFKYFYLLFFILITYLSFIIAKPYLTAILTGAIIAYIFFPVYKIVEKKIKNKNLASLLMCIFIIFLIMFPIIAVINSATEEAKYFYVRAKQKVFSGEILSYKCEDGVICTSFTKVQEYIKKPEVKKHIEQIIAKFSTFILEKASDVVFKIPRLLLSTFIAFFVAFFLFKDGEAAVKRAKNLIPIKKQFRKEIFDKIDQVTHAVIYGSIIIALIQGALGALGFFIFDLGSPILWGFIMSIMALIPFVGTTIIWGPAAAFLIIEGLITTNTAVLGNGIGLLIFGAVLISTIDNILKPKLIGSRAHVHPSLVLIGVFGGLALFGFIGFILGPLILSLFEAFIQIYEKEKAIILR